MGLSAFNRARRMKAEAEEKAQIEAEEKAKAAELAKQSAKSKRERDKAE